MTGNFLIDNYRKGGPIMLPILIVSLVALTVVIERTFWWAGRWFRRDPKRIEKVFTAIEVGDVARFPMNLFRCTTTFSRDRPFRSAPVKGR